MSLKRFVLIGLSVFLTANLVLFGFTRLTAWGSCELYGHETGRDVRFAAFVGCMVKIDESWVPRSELRMIQ